MTLKALQETLGLTPDGVFGPMTLRALTKHFDLKPRRAAHFFAQCAHESGGFTRLEENLNYSAQRLVEVFPRYFPTLDIAQHYDRKPQMIASRVYADRMGNGTEASGDGWKYRGRGAIQLTGRNNYSAFSKYANDPDILYAPDVVAEKYPFESALFFFDANSLWKICDEGLDDVVIITLTKRINGGTLGIDDRIKKTRDFAAILGVA